MSVDVSELTPCVVCCRPASAAPRALEGLHLASQRAWPAPSSTRRIPGHCALSHGVSTRRERSLGEDISCAVFSIDDSPRFPGCVGLAGRPCGASRGGEGRGEEGERGGEERGKEREEERVTAARAQRKHHADTAAARICLTGAYLVDFVVGGPRRVLSRARGTRRGVEESPRLSRFRNRCFIQLQIGSLHEMTRVTSWTTLSVVCSLTPNTFYRSRYYYNGLLPVMSGHS